MGKMNTASHFAEQHVAQYGGREKISTVTGAYGFDGAN